MNRLHPRGGSFDSFTPLTSPDTVNPFKSFDLD